MRYACSNCQKEFKLDKQSHFPNPNCIICGGNLLLEKASGYKNILMSPAVVIERFKRCIDKYGKNEVIKDTRFKHEREAWVSAVWALGLNSISNKEYWIEVETVDGTPDTYVTYFDVLEGNNHRRIFNLEVVDWGDHENELTPILTKKFKKAYPNGYILLVYARNPNAVIDTKKIFGEVRSLKVPFGQVWVLGAPDIDKYTMFTLHPNYSLIDFDFNEAFLKNKNQISFMTTTGRGRGTGLEDLGQLYIPI